MSVAICVNKFTQTWFLIKFQIEQTAKLYILSKLFVSFVYE